MERESEETELFVETETPEPVQAESTEAETEEPLVIETETGTSVNDREQEIQETPEKTEEEKPSEPPALSEGTATNQPDIHKVSAEESLAELARLLGSDALTEAALSNAKEMKEQAGMFKETR